MTRWVYTIGFGLACSAAMGVTAARLLGKSKEIAATKPIPHVLEYQSKLHLGAGFVGDKVEGTLVLTNTSGQDIKLGTVQSSCGCTATLANLETVPAKSEARVPVVMSIKKEGLNEQSLRFPLLTPIGEPAPLVHVLAVGVLPATIEPRSLDFGMVPQERLPLSRMLHVQTHPDWGKALVSIEGDGFAIRQSHSDGYEITATSSLPTGLSVRRVVVQSEKRPPSRMTIPLFIHVNGELELFPRSVAIGPLPVGSAFERHVQLRVKEPGPLEGRWKGDDCSAEIAIADSADAHVVDVTLRGRCGPAGLVRGYIEVELVGKGGRDMVPVMIIGEAVRDNASAVATAPAS